MPGVLVSYFLKLELVSLVTTKATATPVTRELGLVQAQPTRVET